MYYLQIVGLSHTLHALSHMKTDNKRTHNMHFHAHINAQKSANTLLHLLAHKHSIGSPKKTYSHEGMGSYRIVNQTKCVRFTYRWIHTMCPCIKLHLMLFFFHSFPLLYLSLSPNFNSLTLSFFLLLSAFFKSTNANTHSTIFKCHEYHCLYKWIYTYIVQMLQLDALESKNTTFGIHIWNIGSFITHIISYLCNVCTFAWHS